MIDSYEVSQDYDKYVSDQHEVWTLSLERLNQLILSHNNFMHPSYLHGLECLKLSESIPKIEDINKVLKPTGWQTICVNGYIPSYNYAQLISNKIFPMSRSIRRIEHLEYSPAPDLVHDVLGHLPMLFSEEYRTFLQRLACVMFQAEPNDLDRDLYLANTFLSTIKDNPSSPADLIREAEQGVKIVHQKLQQNASDLTLLSRFYLWTIEFGLLGNTDNFKIYGAGLLSAPNEFNSVANKCAPILACTREIIENDINFSDLQEQYFVAKDFKHLHEVLTDYSFSRLTV